MKKFATLLLLSVLISFTSCGEKKEEKKTDKITIQNQTQKKETPKAEPVKKDEATLIAEGKQLFKDKTCFTCHLVNETGIGPSIVDINKIYAEKNYDIVGFLKGELEPIVDTDPGQVAVMKANIDGFVKDLKDQELEAIKAYMLSHN